MGRIFSKAAPYMVHQDNGPVREAAKWLPTVFYGGFKHGFMVQYIQVHKKEYPYFLKMERDKECEFRLNLIR